MKIRQTPEKGFTLIELLVVISIIAILAGIALPAFTGVIEKGNQTKVLSNAKQIYLGMKMFSGDYDGSFPSKVPATGDLNSGALATTSNEAFRNLVPSYIPTEKVFWVNKSSFCNAAPPSDDFSDGATVLDAGTNHFAYVRGLSDTSTPSWPLIADGFKTAGDGAVYTNDPAEDGGLWKGKAAIVVRVDGSGKVENLNTVTFDVKDYAGGADKENIFKTNATNKWLHTDDILVINPPAKP